MRWRYLVLAFVLLSAGRVAGATSFFEVVNRTGSGTTSSATQVVGAGIGFVIGSLQLNLTLNPGDRAFISFIFEGKEAAFRNRFFAADQSVLIDNHAPVGSRLALPLTGGGVLDFGFRANTGGPIVMNADNNAARAELFGIVLDTDRRSGRLLFDDGGAARDSDFDDMVMRFELSVIPVPEPATWLMLLAGLGTIALMRRQRMRRG